MSEHVQVIQHASELPPVWDVIANANPFLQMNSLQILEKMNPCGQKYYHVPEGENGSIAVSYSHRLNVLTFSRLRCFGVPVRMIGVPASVSSCGYVLQGKSAIILRDYLSCLSGVSLVLNAGDPADWPNWHGGVTLPDCQLELDSNGFDAWLNGVRSSYRRRVRQAHERWKEVSMERVAPADFTEEDYALYHAVWKKSDFKLEHLPIGFFQSFPCQIIRFTARGEYLGFVQTLQHEQTLYFVFGGMNYALRDQYDIYWNLLLSVIREGLERGCRYVSLGQTAESVKLRLGCRMVPRYFSIQHRVSTFHRMLRFMAPLLSYKQPEGNYHVFPS